MLRDLSKTAFFLTKTEKFWKSLRKAMIMGAQKFVVGCVGSSYVALAALHSSGSTGSPLHRYRAKPLVKENSTEQQFFSHKFTPFRRMLRDIRILTTPRERAQKVWLEPTWVLERTKSPLSAQEAPKDFWSNDITKKS